MILQVCGAMYTATYFCMNLFDEQPEFLTNGRFAAYSLSAALRMKLP